MNKGTTYKLDRPTMGLRDEDDGTLSGPVSKSIDLAGFQWLGTGRGGRARDRRFMSLSAAGKLTVTPELVAEAVGAGHGDDIPVRLGLSQGAVVIQAVDDDACPTHILRSHKTGSRPTYFVLASKPLVSELRAAGYEIPLRLVPTVYPSQRLVFAKLPRLDQPAGRRKQ